MHFLRINDAVIVILDGIPTANTFPYTTKFIFVGVTNNKTQQIKL